MTHGFSSSGSLIGRYVFCDLSLLFNCESGIDEVATIIDPQSQTGIVCLFHWGYPDPVARWGFGEKYQIRIPMMAEWWHEATDHCRKMASDYEAWQKASSLEGG